MPAFGYFELHTPDLARARAFYSELFGWKFSDVPGMNYAMIDMGGAQGGAMADKDVPPSWLNYQTVDSVDDSAARAKKLGGKVLVPRTEVKDMGWFSVIEDPTGVRFSLWEVKK
jgi:predicted enzyme related to lactoylglutathione lyase